MEYKVKITSQTGEEISFGYEDNDRNTIKDIEINFDTIEDNVYRKGDGSLLHLKIKGDIKYDDVENKTTVDEHIKLFKWTCSEKSEELYRTVNIEVWNKNNRLRVYTFEKMFVEDYTEKYYSSSQRGAESKSSGFELKLTQMENNFDKATSFK